MAPHIRLCTASRQPMTSTGTCEVVLPQLSSDFPTTCHVMLDFQTNHVGVGTIFDFNCTVTFSKHAVNIYSPNGTPIITCWSEPDGTSLWRMYLLPNPEEVPQLSLHPVTHKTSLQSFIAYDLPSAEVIVIYFHAVTGLPVRNTWLQAIKRGNFASWPGLSYQNLAILFPSPIRPSRDIWSKCSKESNPIIPSHKTCLHHRTT